MQTTTKATVLFPPARGQHHDHHQLGLAALLCSTTAHPLNRGASVIHSYMLPLILSSSSSSSSSSSPLSPSLSISSSSSWSCAMGDLIGAESGVCMEETQQERLAKTDDQKRRNYEKDAGILIAKSDLCPPPGPVASLARTVPWVLSRQYVDGKLILREEREQHFEYIQAYRENGRLLLNLIPFDDTIQYRCQSWNFEEDESVVKDDEYGDDDDDDDDDVEAGHQTVQKGSANFKPEPREGRSNIGASFACQCR